MVQQLTSDDRFTKFTPRAKAAVMFAQEEARRLGNNYVGTEHLLLGILREGTGLGVTILVQLSVDPAQLRVTVEGLIPPSEAPTDGALGLTPRAKRAMELAMAEARRLNHHYIGQEHLLLGLVHEGEGIAGSVLRERGVTLERLAAEVLRTLSGMKSGTTTPAPKNNVVTCRLTDDDL